MKTATLIVLICSGLNLLGAVLNCGIKLLGIQFHLTNRGLGMPVLYILLVASLFYYFLDLYKSQNS
jgi:hypothetical protein